MIGLALCFGWAWVTMYMLQLENPGAIEQVDMLPLLRAIEAVPMIDRPEVCYLERPGGQRMAYTLHEATERGVAVPACVVGFGTDSHLSFGWQMSRKYGLPTYMLDVSGTGYSSYKRFDLPTKTAGYEDISAMIRFLRLRFPTQMLFLCAEMENAGLLMNYMAWRKREPNIAGYILASPILVTKEFETMVAGLQVRVTRARKTVRVSLLSLPFPFARRAA